METIPKLLEKTKWFCALIHVRTTQLYASEREFAIKKVENNLWQSTQYDNDLQGVFNLYIIKS